MHIFHDSCCRTHHRLWDCCTESELSQKKNVTSRSDGEGSLPKQELNMNQVRMTQIVFVILQRHNLR